VCSGPAPPRRVLTAALAPQDQLSASQRPAAPAPAAPARSVAAGTQVDAAVNKSLFAPAHKPVCLAPAAPAAPGPPRVPPAAPAAARERSEDRGKSAGAGLAAAAASDGARARAGLVFLGDGSASGAAFVQVTGPASGPEAPGAAHARAR
jgi:hypothetical protein